jgi:cyclic pyranopterin phosphate synthase
MSLASQIAPNVMTDSFGRRIDYVRLSVTDRCDLRCRYCMSERMEFLPRRELLTLEELAQLSEILIARGVRRIRLTGGEPLVRRNIMHLVRTIGSRIGQGLEELTLTTNGTQLAAAAQDLFASGVRRINVSLDSLDAGRFRTITRRGDLDVVMAGIQAAKAAGLSIKINMVVLNGLNHDEVPAMLDWCGEQGFALTLIETMPLGDIDEQRTDRFYPLDAVKEELERRYTLVPTLFRTGGPSRYYEVTETGGKLGLITPLSNNFCAGCNRIRVTATGTVFGCLGHDQKVELRDLLRSGGPAAVQGEVDRLLAGKPERHNFDIGKNEPAVQRHMSVTGG